MLTVVLGAGASSDCTDVSIGDVASDWKPPLVAELFANRSSFNAILNKYPKARGLSGEIRQRAADGEGLETVLLDLSSAREIPVRKQFRHIPLYLQELLGETTTHYLQTGSSWFHTLVTAIERSEYERVLHVTVNYDTYLEWALRDFYDVDFTTLSQYWSDSSTRPRNPAVPWRSLIPLLVRWRSRTKLWFSAVIRTTTV